MHISKSGAGFTASAAVEAMLADGSSAPGITESMIHAFKLTTRLAGDGSIIDASGSGTEHFVGEGAKDIGIAFKLPAAPIKPGDSWTEERGTGRDTFKVEFKFVGLEMINNQRQAKFEERAADAHGGRVEVPTLIVVDADTGVLLSKSAQANVPSGPKPTDPLVLVRSEIKLKG